MFIDSFGSGLN